MPLLPGEAPMSDAQRKRAGLVRARDTLVDAFGNDIGTVVSTATPSPLKWDGVASITFEDGSGRQTIDIPAGTFLWVRKADNA